MPEMKPRTKAPKEEQLNEPLEGELAAYAEVGLSQRSVSDNTAYRYRGVLLRYQKALNGAKPTIETSKIFLAHLHKQGYSPSTLLFTGQFFRVSTLGAARILHFR